MPQPHDLIHLVFTADGGYAMPLAVTLCSAIANADRHRAFAIHIFYTNFPADLRAKVEASARHVGHKQVSIHWREANLADISHLRVVNRDHTCIVYLRLLVPDLLPPDIDKAIFLDADLVFIDDVAKLWDMDIADKALLAARDRIGVVSSPQGLLNYRDLGIPAGAKYFNAGVLVLNLQRWRRQNLAEPILGYLAEHAVLLQMSDQEGLNAMLFNDWGELDFRWNWQVVPDRRRAEAAGCWGLDLTEKGIVHYVTSVKPWLPGCTYPERRLFYQYLDMTEWKGWRIPLWQESIFRLKRGLRQILAATARRRPEIDRLKHQIGDIQSAPAPAKDTPPL